MITLPVNMHRIYQVRLIMRNVKPQKKHTLHSDTKVCPLCCGEVPVPARWCKHCGRNLPPIESEQSEIQHRNEVYKIITERNSLFGIMHRGKIKLHGLRWEKAQSILAILNSMG